MNEKTNLELINRIKKLEAITENLQLKANNLLEVEKELSNVSASVGDLQSSLKKADDFIEHLIKKLKELYSYYG